MFFRKNFLLVLNSKIVDESRLVKLWSKASYKVTVDGGTNRWHDLKNKDAGNSVPDLITGDLDSVRPEVLEHYKDKGSKIVETPDQDHTDFTKALFEIASKVKADQADAVVAFSEHSGRLDQIFSIFETLFHAKTVKDLIAPVFVVSSNSVEWLLSPGNHVIHLPKNHKQQENKSKLHCGLIPLGERCPGVKTKGLKWNLDGDQDLAFGQLVSTSNGFDKDADRVTIFTEKPLLWTMEIVPIIE